MMIPSSGSAGVPYSAHAPRRLVSLTHFLQHGSAFMKEPGLRGGENSGTPSSLVIRSGGYAPLGSSASAVSHSGGSAAMPDCSPADSRSETT